MLKKEEDLKVEVQKTEKQDLEISNEQVENYENWESFDCQEKSLFDASNTKLSEKEIGDWKEFKLLRPK